ncbi:hypothetical protein NPS53_09070 [Pseudomonas putida]|uniref:hypothetical protein n=1 Tax=Pseudomonas putida TaxID=303 RepID=UPI002363790A|nr:hypothetical protein [Pseudomonas putida]MDD2139726.1 hypothetical protein [Pseudomonas putida]HDS1721650.1 hypothetical protein [Pseudomonas putida]
MTPSNEPPVMIPSSEPPLPGRKRQIVAGNAALIATLFLDLQALDWKQYVLILIAIVGFIYAGLIEWEQYKARKEWLKSQPEGPLVGAPPYPHFTHTVAFMVALVSFCALCAYCAPRREIGLIGNELWVLVLIPVSVTAFWFARRIQKQYGKVYSKWRQGLERNS